MKQSKSNGENGQISFLFRLKYSCNVEEEENDEEGVIKLRSPLKLEKTVNHEY